MIKEKIVLVGGGGHCHSMIDVIEQENRYQIIGLVDTKENIGKDVLDYKVIGCDDDLETIFKTCENTSFFIFSKKNHITSTMTMTSIKSSVFQLSCD